MSRLYNNYIEKLASKIEARLSQIDAAYNFDLGSEYELAICHLLSDILPEKFGVCRGFIVSASSHLVGDDIVIYDRLAYPTIRSGVRDFSLKDQIPIEAAYAYIECKHTLTGKKQGPLEKGINQVREAKKLLLTREELPNRIYQNQYRGKHLDWPHHLPRLRNQPFGMLISRFVADDLDVSYLNSLEIGGDESTPDVVVLGSSLIMTPTVALEADGFKTSLFYDPADGIALRAERVPQLALALGLTTLLYALNYIELLPINWGSILNDAFWTGAS